MPDAVDVSVVIGFKDWGIRRLRLAVSSLLDSFGDLSGEVIVSDYGSADPSPAREELEALGARYVYTATDGVWSRSRALNAGFAVSRGRVLVSTDADMVFSPSSMEVIGRWVQQDPRVGLLLQCRDLPEQWSDEAVDVQGLNWHEFERVARRRPRWGMGGMIAVSRSMYLKVRGYDERMQTYGGEDIDFATRVRRAGVKLVWVERPDVRMYHMWHPSTSAFHAKSPKDSADVAANKQIMREDKTFVRNVLEWTHRPPDAPPLVSVVVATHNRADLILDTIHSIQAQTVQDFEIVVVDDGSTDKTSSVLASVGDPRIRYLRQENAGVAAARNRGIEESRGQYVAVLDDDDIALPWRLEAHFEALTEGAHATYGAFANFDNDTGEIVLHRTKLFTGETTADKGGAPGHSTWMVDRELMRFLRYDETLPSGVDNNFALRALRSGLVWRHTGKVHTLRRMHHAQITVQHAERQSHAAQGALDYFTFLMSDESLARLRKERGSRDYVPIAGADAEDLLPFLPDHLVQRRITGEVAGDPQPGDVICTEADTIRVFSAASGVRWRDLAAYRGRLSDARMAASLVSELPEAFVAEQSPMDQVLDLLRAEAFHSSALDESTVAIELSGPDQAGHDYEPPGRTWRRQSIDVRDGDHSRRWHFGSTRLGPETVRLVDALVDGGGSLRLSGLPNVIDQLTNELLSRNGLGSTQ